MRMFWFLFQFDSYWAFILCEFIRYPKGHLTFESINDNIELFYLNLKILKMKIFMHINKILNTPSVFLTIHFLEKKLFLFICPFDSLRLHFVNCTIVNIERVNEKIGRKFYYQQAIPFFFFLMTSTNNSLVSVKQP